MRISVVLLAGLLSAGLIVYLLNQSAYAHSFSGSESASFLSRVHKIQVEAKLAADNIANATLAKQHAENAAKTMDSKALAEIAEINQRIANELSLLLKELQTAVSSSPIDKAKVSQIVTDLDATLGEAVTVRIERAQLTNSTIQAIVLADIIDEVLKNYVEAFDVGFDMTNMSLMAEMNSTTGGGGHSMQLTDDRSMATHDEEASDAANVTVYRDSRFVDLSGKVLPAKDFLHLYDATPYMIMNGHVAAKLPCNGESESALQILIGQAPNMTSAELELIPELSKAGGLCMYHVDLHSSHGTAEGQIITDVAILNPTNAPITFPNTSTVVIGVNEIMPLPEGEHDGGEETSTITNMAAYQSAQAFADKAAEIFQNDLKPLELNNANADAVAKIESALGELQNAISSKAPAMDVMMIVHTQIHPNMQTAYNLQVIPEFPLPLIVVIGAFAALVLASRFGGFVRSKSNQNGML